MRWLKGETPDSSFERLRSAILASSLKTRLMLGLIPPVLFLIALTGYFNYMVSRQFINNALERSALLETIALRNELEGLLDRNREQLSDFSLNNVGPESLERFLAKSSERRKDYVIGIAFLSRKNPDHLIYLANGNRIVQAPAESIRPNLLASFESLKNLEERQVSISPLLEMEFPFPEPGNENQRITRQVFSLATPAFRGLEDRGFLLLFLDARSLRNLLSLHNAEDSPVRGFPRTPEARFFYFFDAEGWVLFESEPPGRDSGDLNTHQVRSRYTGTLGRKGQPFAFRPDSTFEEYWTMVEDVMRGKHGVVGLAAPSTGAIGGSHFLAYAPVRFRQVASSAPTPIGGIAFRDVSRLSQAAGYRHIDLMLIITLSSALLVAVLIYWIGKILTRPILRLAQAVGNLHEDPQPIQVACRGKEIATLQQAINGLIADQQRHLEALRQKERALRDAGLKKEARLERVATDAGSDPVPAIVGRGPRVERLKAEIVKASQVDYDVLILGETGSGKQLAAEAIHRLSARAAGPFVSINCGALDENLLLDTLFGHVRGAFTEAKADRKGAFLEADGGTLFLDEVQVASPRVQQALLRALAERKIKPLGSDREIAVDVRLVAASNADLEALIRRGKFREDLYFRLKVITLHTVPLREQRDNIPLLVRHFLDREEKRTGRKGLGLSRGALAKLIRHDWPGNVRELQNCLMRAVVMAEGPLIHAEDIPLAVPNWEEDLGESAAEEERREETPSPAAEGLNARQTRAWPVILAEGRITRSRYQEIVGGNLPVRTAIYDLQDLVARGLLRKAGKGPATHYLPVLPRRR